MFAVHQLTDERWEILSLDDDPRHPSWRRIAVVAAGLPPPSPPAQHAPVSSRRQRRCLGQAVPIAKGRVDQRRAAARDR
jgi:hypothetical protein